MQPPQPQPLGEVQAQPTPFTPKIFRGHLPDGSPIVIVQFMLLTGVTTLFFPPDAAVALGQEMVTNGRGAASGLILPPNARLGGPPAQTPNGHGSVPTEGDATP